MKVLLLTAIAAGVFLTAAHADEVRNGIWWAKLNHFQHQAYVTGVFDGMSVAESLMRGDEVSARVVWNEVIKIQKLFEGLTSDEVIERLNRFYGNAKNKSVFTADAVQLIALERLPMTPQQKAMLQQAVDDARRRGKKGWPK